METGPKLMMKYGRGYLRTWNQSGLSFTACEIKIKTLDKASYPVPDILSCPFNFIGFMHPNIAVKHLNVKGLDAASRTFLLPSNRSAITFSPQCSRRALEVVRYSKDSRISRGFSSSGHRRSSWTRDSGALTKILISDVRLVRHAMVSPGWSVRNHTMLVSLALATESPLTEKVCAWEVVPHGATH